MNDFYDSFPIDDSYFQDDTVTMDTVTVTADAGDTGDTSNPYGGDGFDYIPDENLFGVDYTTDFWDSLSQAFGTTIASAKKAVGKATANAGKSSGASGGSSGGSSSSAKPNTTTNTSNSTVNNVLTSPVAIIGIIIFGIYLLKNKN